MSEVEYSFNPDRGTIIVNSHEEEDEDQQETTPREASSHPTTTDNNNNKIGASLFGYKVSLAGCNGIANCSKTQALKIIWVSAVGSVGVTLLVVLLWQSLGPLQVGWLVMSSILALLSSWLWGTYIILASASNGTSKHPPPELKWDMWCL